MQETLARITQGFLPVKKQFKLVVEASFLLSFQADSHMNKHNLGTIRMAW